MNRDAKLFIAMVIGTILCIIGSIWNSNHLTAQNPFTDPFLLPIPFIWIGLFIFTTWWFKLRDGCIRLIHYMGNFTVNSVDPLFQIPKEGPYPAYNVWARQGINRPRFIVNLIGGGTKHGYFIAPAYLCKELGVQPIVLVARLVKYVTLKEKAMLPPHLIPELLKGLNRQNLAYDETTPLWFGTKPHALALKVDPEKYEHPIQQIEHTHARNNELVLRVQELEQIVSVYKYLAEKQAGEQLNATPPQDRHNLDRQ